MFRFKITCGLVLLTAFVLASSSGDAQSPGASGPLANGGFSSEANDGAAQFAAPGASAGRPQLQAIDPIFNFGNVYSGTDVRHTFRLKNAGTAPLTINAVRTSCGCTAAQPTKNQILPGEESDLAVTFDTRTDHGPATRTITVLTNDPSYQQLQLTMRGTVKAQVEAGPSVVIFERVKRGTEQAQQVTLTDEMPDRALEVRRITNASPYITVTSRSAPGARPAALLTITLLKTAPAGPITDLIKLSTNRVPVEIPVSGTVLGDIKVNPPQ